MAGRSKKATKKFEKNHLKDTIERRKEFAKIKQRHQVKAKKKARNAKDNAKAVDKEPDAGEPKVRSNGVTSNGMDKFNEMSVDEFFQGGFDLPELKKTKSTGKVKEVLPKTGKRKRHSENVDEQDSNASSDAESQRFSDDEPVSGEEDGIDTHKEDLDALAEKDPEFYKYLQENDADLLGFEGGDLAEIDELSDENTPKKKQKKGAKSGITEIPREDEGDEDRSEVTVDMVNKWKAAMSEQHSLRAMRQIVLAFRAAAYVNSDDSKQHKYTISNPDVYHQLLVVALEHVPNVLSHHLPAKESKTGKVYIATDSKKYRTMTPLLKSHSASVIRLLDNLSDAPTLKLTFSCLNPLLPYLLSFKKILKSLVQTTVEIWADTANDDSTRVSAFLILRRLAIISDNSVRTAVLKTTYQGLVKGSRITNAHTLSSINLMKNSAAELWGLDPTIGYTTGFVYIRQLAVHLRTSITHPTKDSYKQIYNWQYTHSLDFWSRVLSIHCSPNSNPSLKAATDSPLHPLLYPLVQITLGALRLIPTPSYFPLRFHLTRSLLRLSRATGTYIPLAPSLLEVLQSAEMTKHPKASTLKPLDFSIVLRAPKLYLRSSVYQKGVGEQLVELTAEFFWIWAKHIAFPELILPPTVQMKRWLKSASTSTPKAPSSANKKLMSKCRKGAKGRSNTQLTSRLTLLVQKLESNARWIQERRRQVDFGPGNRAGVESFLRDVPVEDTPLGAFVEGERKRREDRERVLQSARENEGRERRNGRERGEDEDEMDMGSVGEEEEEEGEDE